MSIESASRPAPVPHASAVRDGVRTEGAGSEREQLRQLAQEFEAFVMAQMLRQMRQSMLTEEAQGDGFGNGILTDTFDVELARHLSMHGGFGLAHVLEAAFAREMKPAGSPTPVAPAPTADEGAYIAVAGISAVPGAGTSLESTATGAADEESPAVAMPLDARVSSRFGYRRDPFNGDIRFHGGIDIAAAYGRAVPAAAPGRVVFSGEQGGYGQTVVVEHDGGLRTRYAHLSSIDVRPGQRVDAGAQVGRVGQSGRSTGPHLHFEVLENGRRVDPEAVAARFAAQLKSLDVGADFPNSHSSGRRVAAGADDANPGQSPKP